MFHLIARSYVLKKLEIRYVKLIMAKPKPNIVQIKATILLL